MSSNPYHDLPNLSHIHSDTLEQDRAGDPSRFYPSVRKGQADAVTGRILDMPRVSVYRSFADSQTAPLRLQAWDVVDYDTDAMFDPVVPTQLTARSGGLYLFCLIHAWDANAVGYRQHQFVKTDARGVKTLYDNIQMASPFDVFNFTFPIPLFPGEYVEVWTAQGSGGALGILASTATVRENGFAAFMVSTFGSD